MLTEARWINFETNTLRDQGGALAVRLDGTSLTATINGIKVADASIITSMLQGAAVTDDKLAESYIKADGTRPMAANLNLGGYRITNLADGIAASDAVTKQQLDANNAGLDPKESCRFATKAPITAGVFNANGGVRGQGGITSINTEDTAIFDLGGYTMQVGDRILVKNQADPIQNGIYEVITIGTGTAGSFERAADFNESPANEVTVGAYTLVELGTDYENTGWTVQHPGGGQSIVTINTSPVYWVQFTGLGLVTAGLGLSKDANVLDFDVNDAISGPTLENDGTGRLRLATQGNGLTGGGATLLAVLADGSTITVGAGGIKVSTSGITANELATDAVITAKIQNLAITADKLASNSVLTSKIINDAVTKDKINSDVAGNGLQQAVGGELEVKPDITTGGDVSPVSVGINGVGLDVTSLVGDHLTVTFTPTYYTPTGVAEADDLNDLAAHLKGIDDAFTALSKEIKITETFLLSSVEVGTTGNGGTGFVTLSQEPSSPESVQLTPHGGPEQMNQAIVGSTGATPDFTMDTNISTKKLHLNNVDAGVTGLSEAFLPGDIIIVEYTYVV